MNVQIHECHRENLCFECDDKKCWHAGELIADCPLWKCNRKDDLFEDCESCELLKQIHAERSGETIMTLKQIAKKYNLDYFLLYQGLDDQGLLRRYRKNVEYDERVVLNACQRYLYRRILKLRNKMAGLQADRDEIVQILKNGFTE